jgi:adenylylsulfate kinase
MRPPPEPGAAGRDCTDSWGPPGTWWFTGLSGAGKSTLADACQERLQALGLPCLRLDGDALRSGPHADLGYSAADRRENIRRAAVMARGANDRGLWVLASFISPLAVDRALARELIGADRYVEVFVDAPVAVCEARDPKGLYRRARAGEIVSFTGISAPYEAPQGGGHLRLDTAVLSVDEAVAQLSHLLRASHRGPVSSSGLST